MFNSGWSRIESPFHAGELAIQARLGVLDRINKQGRQIIRTYLTLQHRQFFAQLSYVLVGTVDADGKPWASILVGNPGFLSTPDDRTLRITATPLLGDPLTSTLTMGAKIGLLGIELHTRRRNRLNGFVTAVSRDGFDVQVEQSFGNCPQYIQARQFEIEGHLVKPSQPIHPVERLGDMERAMITRSDTFFITTAYQAAEARAASGVDVSHRGGKPGFVRLDDDQTLTVPDFSGNHHFNTFGNLELNPRAGLLFLDFDRGDLLYLTGTAKVIWDGMEVSAYAGAERLLQFSLTQGYRVEGSLPLRWSQAEFSPFLDRTGSW
ncbi:MAG: pyridoxamine 5'-phosphate oxidase family protein [Stenomitos rutilans HA7619-LM2]|jgi:hypothetical protein|nr:pyridoxamine 5'-phosphate oxidase family protein [Stenomitos rutilans HA7619-LM2]